MQSLHKYINLKDKRREDDINFIDFSLLILVLTEYFKVATGELACSSLGQKFLSHELHGGTPTSLAQSSLGGDR